MALGIIWFKSTWCWELYDINLLWIWLNIILTFVFSHWYTWLIFKLELPSSPVSLNISDGKKIEEIIGHVGEEVKKICTSFSELKLLKLSYLTRLTSFCFENYTLEFPSLERVSMIHCPNMKTFSQGFLRTPKLCKVQVTKKEEDELRHWEGNLNSTVRKCYKEMACVNQLSPLHLHIFIFFFSISFSSLFVTVNIIRIWRRFLMESYAHQLNKEFLRESTIDQNSAKRKRKWLKRKRMNCAICKATLIPLYKNVTKKWCLLINSSKLLMHLPCTSTNFIYIFCFHFLTIS